MLSTLRLILIFTILQQFNITTGKAQNNKNHIHNPDSLFSIACNLAANQNLAECREMCYKVLNSYPAYTDFTLLAARTLAWEQLYDSAIALAGPLIGTKPPVKEAYILLSDIDIWQVAYRSALVKIDTALKAYPGDSVLMAKREDILNRLQDTLPLIANTNLLAPDSNAVGMAYYFDFFSEPFISRRHVVTLNYTRITNLAPVTARLNIGNTVINNGHIFQKPSLQFEADAYPKIGKKGYLYLNYGIGQKPFFPVHRFGSEYFRTLNYGFEASGGIRYMYWDNSILFLTASVAKYLNRYWLSFRPYFALMGKNFANVYTFETRRYFNVSNSYLFAQVIFGDSPDQPLVSAERNGNFKSSQYQTGIQYRYKQWFFGTSVGYQNEEYFINQFRNRYNLRLSVNYVF